MSSFNIGRLVMSRTINDTATDNTQFAKDITTAMRRYLSTDWGDLCKADKMLNDKAVKTGLDRILAAYDTDEGKVYIITENDRSYTTILFANEY